MNFDLNLLGPYALVILAGLFAHACFQLSLSVLTLMNSHAIGKSKRHTIVVRRSLSYTFGAMIATLGLLIASVYLFSYLIPINMAPSIWIVVCSILFVVGWLAVLVYYRRGKGTRLWLPRGIVTLTSNRAKKIGSSFDALGLGFSMVIAELPFLIAPLLLVGAVLATVPNVERSIGVVAYTFAATLPLIIVTALIGGGHKISEIQRWRETNKYFLQWTSGLTLILLSIYLFAINIWGKAA